MDHTDLSNIVAYAIEKEQEAMDFYLELADKAGRDEVAHELRKIAAMEKGHRDRLEKIQASGVIAGAQRESAPDLQIADYMVDQEPSDTMDWQDVIAIAMKRELAAQRLYTDLANLATDAAVKDLFQGLAKDEAAHKNYFETLWDDNVLTDN